MIFIRVMRLRLMVGYFSTMSYKPKAKNIEKLKVFLKKKKKKK